jgi:hypothetical protein
MKKIVSFLMLCLLYVPFAYSNEVSEVEMPQVATLESSVYYGSLVPGSDVYPCDIEILFSGGYYNSDQYTFEWSVDNDGEGDAIADGKVTIEVQDTGYEAVVTFERRGIYNVNLAVYEDGVLVAYYTTNAIVVA